MKKFIFVLGFAVILSSCSSTIPLVANLSDQTVLLAKNKNIKADYTLESDIHDGYIPYVYAQKNGTEKLNGSTYKYASETAFKKIWNSYFSNKFNNYAKDQMSIIITLKNLELKEQYVTSIGSMLLTGNSKENVEAIATFHVLVNYHGKKYEKQFEITTSDYNESQQMRSGNYYYSVNQKNPTQQKAELLQNCFNKSVIQFDNFINSILLTTNNSK
jgi:hypothetical protein